MRRWVGLVWLWLVLGAAVLAQSGAVPKPGYGGDYWLRNEQTWPGWEVVSPVVARRHAQWPTDWESPGALLNLRWDIWQWPEVTRFGKGARLEAWPDSVGGIIVKDEDGYSWLRIRLPGDQLAFVRANRKWIRPAAAAAPEPAGSPSPQASPEQTPSSP